jgi:membrane fusion protein (multidrug efflux system)
MLLTVELIRARRQAASVPAAALVPIGEQQHVFVLGPEDTVKRVPIEIGQRGERYVEVTRGLEPDEEIVVDGTIKLRPGARVTAQRRESR